MKKAKSCNLTAKLAVSALAITASAHAQYVPPTPSQPSAGLINDALRAESPEFDAWDFGGAERLRFEDHEGYGIQGLAGTPAAPNNDFRSNGADVANSYLLSRLRVHLGYTETWWSAYVAGESSLALDDQRFGYANVPAVAGTSKYQGYGPENEPLLLYQAYVTLGDQKAFPLLVKVGRQELSYGEERLVGAFDWNNIGRVFDAAKARWQNDWFWADAFVSRPVIPEAGRFNNPNYYDWFSGLYASTGKLPKNTLDLYFFSRNTSPQAASAAARPQFPQPGARDIYTVGGRVKSKPGELDGWDYSLEGAYQFGDFRDTRPGALSTQRLEQDAFAVVAIAGYTFTNAWGKPRLGLEYDYASGGSTVGGKHETFDNLFPTNHKFYGAMDFVSLQNVQDLGANLTLKPTRTVSVALEGNAFFLASTEDSFYTVSGGARGGAGPTPGTGYGVNPGYSNFLGTELTAIAGWAMTSYASIEGGYGHFFHDDYISETWAGSRGARDADFAYAQLTARF